MAKFVQNVSDTPPQNFAICLVSFAQLAVREFVVVASENMSTLTSVFVPTFFLVETLWDCSNTQALIVWLNSPRIMTQQHRDLFCTNLMFERTSWRNVLLITKDNGTNQFVLNLTTDSPHPCAEGCLLGPASPLLILKLFGICHCDRTRAPRECKVTVMCWKVKTDTRKEILISACKHGIE